MRMSERDIWLTLGFAVFALLLSVFAQAMS